MTMAVSPVAVTPVTMTVMVVSVSPWVTIVPTTAAPRSTTVTMSVSMSLVQQGRSPDVDGRVTIGLKGSGLTSDQPGIFGLFVVVDLVARSAVFQVEVLDVLVRGQRSASSTVLELSGPIVGDANVSPGAIVLSILSASSFDDGTSSVSSVRDGEPVGVGGA